jgi:ABC-2 type transport system ATP-binding protein
MDLAVETAGSRARSMASVPWTGSTSPCPSAASTGFSARGTGKSTILKGLTGLLRPSAGSMRILGRDPVTEPVAVKRGIGVVSEDLALFERLTAEETLAFVGRVYGLDTLAIGARTDDLLALMDLEAAGKALVADFSHGMKKKLALAAALLPAPRLLFLDEPFEGIDALASRQIKDLLLAFVARGGTIFLTSHILEIVERLCTHIGVIARGRLVSQGPIEALRGGGEAGLEERFIGLVGDARPPRPALDWL